MKVSREEEPPVNSENAFAGLLALGTIVFFVVAWLDNEPDLEPVEKYDSSLLALWPHTGPRTWPPPGRRFDFDALEDLAGTFGRVPTLP